MADERQPFDATQGVNWQAIVVAATTITILNLFVLTFVTHRGWLAGTAFPKPLGLRLSAYGALNIAFVIAPLALYQSLRPRAKGLALGVYLGIVLAFSVGSIPVLNEFVARGVFVFSGPYSTTWDVTWGAAQYLIAFGLCEIFSRITRSR